MDARALYQAAKTRKGIGGVLLRLLVFVYVRIRPRWPGRSNERVRVFEQYLEGRGDVLLVGSSEPHAALTGFGANKLIRLDVKPLEHVDVVADAEALSAHFPDGAFDYVACNSTLNHAQHP